MKTRLFKAAVAIALVASAPAWAADLPVKAAPPAVIAPTWTGLYLGANVGYSAGTSSVGSTTNLVGVFTASLVGASDLSLTGASTGADSSHLPVVVVGADQARKQVVELR